MFVVAVFALLQREDLRDRLIRLVGSDDLHRTTLAIDDGGRRLSKYFITQLSINSAFGLVIGVCLFFIGVPNPILWGILSALLRFVPYVGSFIAAVLPLGLAAAVEPGLVHGAVDGRTLPRGGGHHRPGDRTAGVRPQHRAVAVLRRRRRHLLVLAVGADRADPLDPADACAWWSWGGTSSGWSSWT